MIINGKDLEKMEERYCSNCHFQNDKYKILACKLHNKQVKFNHCCPLHHFKKRWKQNMKKLRKEIKKKY